jgi:hypothetical protein
MIKHIKAVKIKMEEQSCSSSSPSFVLERREVLREWLVMADHDQIKVAKMISEETKIRAERCTQIAQKMERRLEGKSELQKWVHERREEERAEEIRMMEEMRREESKRRQKEEKAAAELLAREEYERRWEEARREWMMEATARDQAREEEERAAADKRARAREEEARNRGKGKGRNARRRMREERERRAREEREQQAREEREGEAVVPLAEDARPAERLEEAASPPAVQSCPVPEDGPEIIETNKTETPESRMSGKENIMLTIQHTLEAKLEEKEELARRNQTTIDEKSKEMAGILTSIDQLNGEQVNRSEELSSIDEAIKALQDKRSAVLKESEDFIAKKAKAEKKKRRLEEYIDSFANQAKVEEVQLEKEIEELNTLLSVREDSPEEAKSPPASNAPLLHFIERQILELEQELECPVCLEPAVSPIMKCEEEHLICSPCRGKVATCPECRAPYPAGPPRRFRAAERQAARLAGLRRERGGIQ